MIDSGCHSRFADEHRLADRIAIVRRHNCFEATDDRGGDSEYQLHGTHVCDIVRRVAPGAVIGTFTVRDRREAEAVDCAVRCAIALGYQIVNCSIAESGDSHVLRVYKSWIDLAYARGVHIVAAGHNRRASEVWPAWFPSVIAVAADNLPEDAIVYAPTGTTPLVEFVACGSTLAPMSGAISNSYAAPRVAGLLARLVARVPDITPLEAKALLREMCLVQSGRT